MNRQVWVAMLLILVLGAGGAWLLLHPSRAAQALVPGAGGGPKRLAKGAAEPSVTKRNQGHGSKEAAPIVSVPFAARDAEPWPPGALAVHVLDARGDPLPGVTVLVQIIPSREGPHLWRSSLQPRLVRRLWSDKRGLVAVTPPSAGPFRLVGRLGGAAGVLQVVPRILDPKRELVLRLHADRLVRVSVVDRQGQPVPHVLVRQQGNAEREASGWSRAPSGVAELAVTALGGPAFQMPGFVPQADLAGETVTGPAVPWAAHGVTKARVVVERGRIMLVRISDSQGKPAPSCYRLEVARAQSSTHLGALSGSFSVLLFSKHGVARRFTGSEVSLAGFKTGSSWRLTLHEKGHLPVLRQVTLPAGGQPFVVTLQRGVLLPHLSLHLQDGEGKPLLSKSLLLRVAYGEGTHRARQEAARYALAPLRQGTFWLTASHAAREFQTDDHGRLLIPLRPGVGGRLFFYPANLLVVSGGAGEQLQSRAFAALRAGEERDGGILPLPGLKTLVAGRVLWPGGQPASGALVKVMLNSKARGQLTFKSFQFMRLLARTDARGRFRLISSGSQKGLLLVASMDGRLQAKPRAFQPGEREVQLWLQPTGGLAGRLLSALSGRVPPISITARPTRRDSLPDSGRGSPTRLQEDGSFHLNGLVAGPFEVRVYMGPIQVLRVQDVWVHPGKISRDPRLDGVLVGGDLELGQVTLLDEEERPIKGATVVVRVPRGAPPLLPGELRQRKQTTDAKGHANFLLPRRAIRQVLVRAPGRPETLFEDQGFPATLRVGRGCTVTVTITNAALLPHEKGVAGYEVRLLSLRGKQTARPQTGVLDLQSGLARIPHMPPGLARVELLVLAEPLLGGEEAGKPGGSLLRDVLPAGQLGGAQVTIGRLDVPEGRLEHHVKLTVDLARLERARQP